MSNEINRLQKLAGILTESYEPMTKPSPSNPDRETIERPTTAPEPKPRRRTLTPPTEAPDTKPKAEGLLDKIADRYNDLSSEMDEGTVGRFQKLAGINECDCEHNIDEISVNDPGSLPHLKQKLADAVREERDTHPDDSEGYTELEDIATQIEGANSEEELLTYVEDFLLDERDHAHEFIEEIKNRD